MSMTCTDLRRLDDCYLDDELAHEERAEVDGHLATCEACRADIAAARHLRSVVRAKVRRPEVPAALRGKVLAALDKADRPPLTFARAASRALPYASGFLAAALVAMVVGQLVRAHVPDEKLSAEDAVATHAQNLPLDVQGDAEHVSSFLAGRIPLAVTPPRLGTQNASLQGARLSHMRGREAAQLRYQVNRKPVTVTVFDARGTDMSGMRHVEIGRYKDAWAGQAQGYNVVIIRHEGVGYAFTSALNQQQMVDLATAASFEP